MSIDDLIDPKKPGHLRPQVLLTPSEFMEAGRLGSKSASGKNLKLIEPAIDPLSGKALRPLAPPELRKGVDDAQAQLEESSTITTAAFKKWRMAMAERSKFDREMGAGPKLTDAGVKRGQQLEKAIEDAAKYFHDAEDCESAARVAVVRAENQVRRWVYDERLRQQEETRLATEAARKPKAIPLTDRLSALKKKVTG